MKKVSDWQEEAEMPAWTDGILLPGADSPWALSWKGSIIQFLWPLQVPQRPGLGTCKRGAKKADQWVRPDL